MERRLPPPKLPDWAAIAKARGFDIPADEIEEIGPVLDLIVLDCREAFRRDLCLVEPIGTFRPGDTSSTD